MQPRLPLDTHVLVWALQEPDRLSTRARQAIVDPDTVVVVSAVSAWEIAIKRRLGKWPQVHPIIAGYPAAVHQLRATELPITAAHALFAGSMDWPHRDPFDRMLVAQSAVEGLTLVTADAVLTGHVAASTLW